MKRPIVTATPTKPDSPDSATASDGAATATVLIRPFPLTDILTATYPQPEPVIDRLLKPGEVVLMIGRAKEGKSLLMLQLAIDIGAGRPFLEEYATRAGAVLYVDFENQLLQIQQNAIGLKRDRDVTNVFIKACERATGLTRDVGLFGDRGKRLKEMVAEYETDLLIIDPLRYAAPKTGNNEEKWAVAMIDAVSEIQAARPTMPVIIVHHVKKSQHDGIKGLLLRDDPRSWIEKIHGSQALLAHVDGVWGLSDELEGYTFATVPRAHELVVLRLEKVPGSEVFLKNNDKLAAFSPEMRAHWNKLPSRFTWHEAEMIGLGKSTLNRLVRKAESSGALGRRGLEYFKVD